MSVVFSVVILMPVFNDWESAALLWQELDRAFASLHNTEATILCIDDGSVSPPDPRRMTADFRHLNAINILRLRRNVGHQRAIAIGLTEIYEHMPCDAVVCMDADGEDRAADVPLLLEKFQLLGRNVAIFAARRKRLEGRLFQFGYLLFRFIHLLLVGFSVKIGNFSVLAFEHLSSLIVSPDLWSHYAATVVKLRIPMQTVPADRGPRYAGRSKMSYITLVSHGLSAISVFGETVATRILIGVLLGLSISLVTAVLVLTAVRGAALSFNWITVLVAFSLLTILDALSAASVAAFAVLSKRDQLGFLPIRDYGYFVRELTCVYERHRVQL